MKLVLARKVMTLDKLLMGAGYLNLVSSRREDASCRNAVPIIRIAFLTFGRET